MRPTSPVCVVRVELLFKRFHLPGLCKSPFIASPSTHSCAWYCFSHTFHALVCWQEFFEEVWVYLTTLPMDNFQQEERWQQDMVRMQVSGLRGKAWGAGVKLKLGAKVGM